LITPISILYPLLVRSLISPEPRCSRQGCGRIDPTAWRSAEFVLCKGLIL